MATEQKSVYREYLLDTNNFEQPRILEDQQAIAALLTRLILLEPGTNPLFPTMGVGLVSKYRYMMQDKENQLKNDIRDQIATFLPQANCTNVNLIYNNDKTIDIEITVDNTVFVYQSSKLIPIQLQDLANS